MKHIKQILFFLSLILWLQGLSMAQLFDTTPINDLGNGLYLNQFQGGLYENGTNMVPVDHEILAMNAAAQMGQHGKFVFLGIGMSVSSGEFDTLMSFAKTDAAVNHTTMVMLDGARGSAVACSWTYVTGLPPSSCYFGTTNDYDYIRDHVLAPTGLTEAQVEAVWIEVTNAHPATPWDCNQCVGYSLPAVNADAYTLEDYLGEIVRAVRHRYPNVHQMFLSTRAYAGYSTINLSPEPFAFENGFSSKWLIQAQVTQERTGIIDPIAGDLSGSPVLMWGSYNWASYHPRIDGLVWNSTDFKPDGVHFIAPSNTKPPTILGVNKVGLNDLNYFKQAPETPWFRK